MVTWFKHDIPAWMNGTESLSDGAYRLYHVICQLIYLNEGPIALNERGLAGRCRQTVRTFHRNLTELLSANKLTLRKGHLSNPRAELELKKIQENRKNAGKGGGSSGESRKTKTKSPTKLLENNDPGQAPLQNSRSLKEKKREEESKQDEDARTTALRISIVKAFEEVKSVPPDTSRVEVWIAQGYDPDIVLAVIRNKLATKRSTISTLNFFDGAIKDAHDNRAPTPTTLAGTDWDAAINAFKSSGNWPQWAAGSEPGMAGCVVPSEVLRKHGFDSTVGKAIEAIPGQEDPHKQGHSRNFPIQAILMSGAKAS
jgi:hypothetical protein